MKKNIGTADRVARLLIGVMCFISVYCVGIFLFQIVLALLGVFCVYEALVGWCAFYQLLGRNTCPIE